MAYQSLFVARDGSWSRSYILAEGMDVSRTFVTTDNGPREWIEVWRNASAVKAAYLVTQQEDDTYAVSPYPEEDALEFEANPTRPTLFCTRYRFMLDNDSEREPVQVDIDEVKVVDSIGNQTAALHNGKPLTLIAITSEEDLGTWKEAPSWVGQNVTGDPRFRAENLIAYPWPEYGPQVDGISAPSKAEAILADLALPDVQLP